MVDLDGKVVILRHMILVKEKDWGISISRTQSDCEILYSFDIVRKKYDPETGREYYAVENNNGILLGGLHMEKLKWALDVLSSDYGEKLWDLAHDGKMRNTQNEVEKTV